MEGTETTTNKQIKFKSSNKSLSSSTSLNNLSGDITFTNLKQLAQILSNTKNQSVIIFYEDSEIDINEESATLNEIFEGIDEITIEIKLKETNLTNKNSEQPNKNFRICERHLNEFAKTFCDLCKRNICFRCSIDKEHKAHKYDLIISEFQNKSKNVEDKFNEVNKLLKSGNGYTKETLNKLKSFHIFKVSSDFDVLFQKLDDVRNFYYDFYTDYFMQTDKSLTALQEDFRKLSIKYNSLGTISNKNLINNNKNVNEINRSNSILNSSQTLQNGISSITSNKTNIAENLQNLENFERDLNSFLRTLKVYSNLKDIRCEFDGEYENYKNSLNHKLDMIQSEFFDESKLKRFDKLTQTENEDILIKNYLETFVEDFNKIHSRISMPIPLTKNLIQYDSEWNEISEISIAKQNYTFKFKKNSKFLNFKDYLFVSGGMENFNSNFEKPSQSCFLISIPEGRILELANMIKPRSSHSLIYNEKMKIIFAISGYENSSVEIFLPLKNKWLLFKPLNKWRCHANVLFADDNKYMYVFGGKFIEEFITEGKEKENTIAKSSSNTFERISIEKLKNIIVNYSNLNKIEDLESLRDYFESDVFNLKQSVDELNANMNFYGFGVMQLNENKFLVFGGGSKENESEMSDQIRIFEHEKNRNNKFSLNISNFDDCNEKEILSLPEKCFFQNQSFLKLSDKFYGQFNNSGNMIIYNLDTQKFEVKKNELEK